jgi:PAS domain S-box-containing protein
VRVPCEVSASWMTVDEQQWVLAIVRDVRERRRMEAELRDAERRYRDLYEHAPFAYFSVGRDGYIRLANRRAVEMLGRDDLVGMPVLELYDPDSPAGRQRARSVLRRFQAGEEVRDEELEMRAANGRSV